MGSPTLFTNQGANSFIPANDNTNPIDLINIGLSASVATNALTISLKTADGNDPSAGSPVYAKFRVPTLTLGTSSVASATGAVSITVPSTGTLGQISTQPEYVYVYLLNNSGSLELAVSTTNLFSEYTTLTTTALGASPTSRTTLYSSTQRVGVAIRLIGRVLTTQATAGTWASAPSEVAMIGQSIVTPFGAVWYYSPSGYGSSATKIPYFANTNTRNTATGGGFTASMDSTNGTKITITKEGVYGGIFNAQFSASVLFGISYWQSGASPSVTTNFGSLSDANVIAFARSTAADQAFPATFQQRLFPGDQILPHADGTGAGSNSAAWRFMFCQMGF